MQSKTSVHNKFNAVQAVRYNFFHFSKTDVLTDNMLFCASLYYLFKMFRRLWLVKIPRLINSS